MVGEGASRKAYALPLNHSYSNEKVQAKSLLEERPESFNVSPLTSYALSVDPRRLRADAERAQERFDDLVTFPAPFSERLSLRAQEHAAIASLLDQAFETPAASASWRRSAVQRQVAARCPPAWPRRQINQVGDESDIVLDQLAAPIAPSLTEALHLLVGVDQASGLSLGLAFAITILVPNPRADFTLMKSHSQGYRSSWSGRILSANR